MEANTANLGSADLRYEGANCWLVDARNWKAVPATAAPPKGRKGVTAIIYNLEQGCEQFAKPGKPSRNEIGIRN